MKANKIVADLCAVTMSLMTFNSVSLPAAYAYEEVAYTGSVTLTIDEPGDIWRAKQEISMSELLGDIDPWDVSAIEFSNDSNNWFSLIYRPAEKDPGTDFKRVGVRDSIRFEASKIDFDNYSLSVCLDTGDVGDTATISWKVIVDDGEAPLQTDPYSGDWSIDNCCISGDDIDSIPDGDAMEVTVSYSLMDDYSLNFIGINSYSSEYPSVEKMKAQDYISGITLKDSLTDYDQKYYSENVGEPLLLRDPTLIADGFIQVFPLKGKQQELTFTVSADGVRYFKELAEKEKEYPGYVTFEVFGVNITNVQVKAVFDENNTTRKYSLKQGIAYNSPFHFEAPDLAETTLHTTAKISLSGITYLAIPVGEELAQWYDTSSYYICVTDPKGIKKYYAVGGSKVNGDIVCVEAGNEEDSIIVPGDEVIHASSEKGNVTVEVPFGYGYSIDIVGLSWKNDGAYSDSPYFKVNDIVVGIYNSPDSQYVKNPDFNQPEVTYQTSRGCIQLNWDHVFGAEKYGIYMGVDGKLAYVGETTDNSFLITGLPSSKTYTIGVFSMYNGKWYPFDLHLFDVTSAFIPLEYRVLDDGTAEITKCNDDSTDITIPDSIDGHTITSIGDHAFEFRESLESVTIPDTVTNMGNYAFYGCPSLAYVNIPDSLTAVRDGTFENCISLKSVTLPDSITEIGDAAFDGCTSLSSIAIPKSVTEFGGGAFLRTKWLENKRKNSPLVVVNNILIDARTASGNVTVPGTVKKIADQAFFDNRSVTSVAIPNSVTSIGDSSFAECTLLKSVTFPESMTTIGHFAFFNCTSLKTVTVPESVGNIGINAFGYYYLKDDDGVIIVDDAKVDGFKILCCTGTAAEEYAAAKGFDYELLDGSVKNPAITYQKGDGAVKLNWTPIANADKYAVAAYVNGKWTKVAAVSGTSYILKGLTAGKQYKVAVLAKINGKWNTDLSNAITVTPNAPAYPAAKAEVQGNAFRLSWTSVPNAKGYAIGYTANGKTWKLAKTVKAGTTSFTYKNAPKGTYYLVVCANVNGKYDTKDLVNRAVKVVIK